MWHKFRLLPALAIAILSVALLFWVRPIPEEPDLAHPAPPPTPAEHSPPRPPAASSRGVMPATAVRTPVESADSDCLVLHVQDENRQPVEGAAVRLLPRRAQWIDAHADVILGNLSDDTGLLRLERADFSLLPDPASDKVAVVEHPSFLPHALSVEHSEQVVTLITGHRVLVTCHLENGDPLSGVVIAISRLAAFGPLCGAVTSALRYGKLPRPGGPSLPSRVALARTDDSGVADFAGCPPGQYAFVVGHESYVPVAGPASRTSHIVPGQPIRLIMAPVVGAVIRVPDDALVLSQNTRRASTDFERASRFAQRGGIAAALFRERHGEHATVYADVPSRDLRARGLDPQLHFSVLFPSGWDRRNIFMTHIADPVGPSVFRPPPGPNRTGSLVTHVIGIAPSHIAGVQRPTVEFMAPFEGGMVHRVVSIGQTVQVPGAKYEIHSWNPWIHGQHAVEVAIGKTTDIALVCERELYPCLISPRASDGLRLPSLKIRIRETGDSKIELLLRSWTPQSGNDFPEKSAVQWLPRGEVRVEVSGTGLAPASLLFEVRSSTELQPIDIPLRAEDA